MGARQRLNSLYFLAVLIVAALIGSATQSWSLFLISATIMTVLMIYDGDIRPTPQPPRTTQKTRKTRKTRKRR